VAVAVAFAALESFSLDASLYLRKAARASDTACEHVVGGNSEALQIVPLLSDLLCDLLWLI
jgi:hypothetical protein